jgi:hypothetical protein
MTIPDGFLVTSGYFLIGVISPFFYRIFFEEKGCRYLIRLSSEIDFSPNYPKETLLRIVHTV